MSNNKIDPRAHIALDITSNVFMNSATRFTNIGKIGSSNAVQERLNQRASQAIKSKSPQNRKLQTIKISQLGSSPLFQGLDMVPQRGSKSPGNQQRLKTALNQSSLTPQKGRNQPLQINNKNQKTTEIKINQNFQRKPIQRQHNRAQNQVNTSRYRGQTKQVVGNMVSQNLLKNQKSTKDDFNVGDKSIDKNKNSISNQKGQNLLSIQRNYPRNLTQSRAQSAVKQKKVSFSPQKPRQNTIQKREIVQTKKTNQIKVVSSSKVNSVKQQPYVYVPPQRKALNKQQEKGNYSSQLPKQENKALVQKNVLPYRSLSPQKEQIKKAQIKIQSKPKNVQIKATTIQVKNTNVQVKNVNQVRSIQPIKIKSKAELISAQQSPQKTTTGYNYQANQKKTQAYVYQPPQKKQLSQSDFKSQQKRVYPIKRQQSPKKNQTSQKSIIVYQKKVEQPLQKNDYLAKRLQFTKKNQETVKRVQISPKKSEPRISTQKPNPRQVASYSTIKTEQNIEVKKMTTLTKVNQNTINKSNVSLNVSSKQKISPSKQQDKSRSSRNKEEVSADQLRRDWSKIKSTLKYDKSLSPTHSNKKVSVRQDVAMKMLAQIFLNASTRYFPGLSSLLKRGMSKQQIQAIRSKSTDFKINVLSADRKSPTKQPRTERKLNWKQSSPQKSKQVQKQNNRVFQADVTVTQYKIKKAEQKEQQNIIPKTQPKVQQRHPNIVSESLQKNHKKVTRDDFLINKHQKQPSEKSGSIRESPDIFKRQISKHDVQQSKKQVAKMKSQSIKNYNYSPNKNESNYVYQPLAKRNQSKSIQESPKKSSPPKQTKVLNEIAKPLGLSKTPLTKQPIKSQPVKPQPIKHEPIKIQQVKPQPIKPQTVKQDSKQLNASKSSINIIQTPQKAIQRPIHNQQAVTLKTPRPLLQEKKPVVYNYGQNSSKTIQSKPKVEETKPIQYQIKPQPIIKAQQKKTQIKRPINQIQNPNESSQKNINVSQLSSKSQTSIWIQPQVKKTIERKTIPAYQSKNQTQSNTSSSGYVYQPPSKRDNTNNTQENKQQATINSLRNVQSQKIFRPAVTPVAHQAKQKIQSTPLTMPKKQQKSITANVEISPKQVKPTVVHREIIPKQTKPIAILNNPLIKQTKQSTKPKQINKSAITTKSKQSDRQIKQPSILSKKFCTIVALVIKKRLSSNLAYSLDKIKENSLRKDEILRQASFIFRSIATFDHNYQQILKRHAFNKIKASLVLSVNKIIKEDKPIQQNIIFSSGKKQSAVRIIGFLLKQKLSSYLQPIRMRYLQIKNHGKTKDQVIQALIRVCSKRILIHTKGGFKNIKSYKNKRQEALKQFGNLLGKIKYTAVSNHFSTLVSKDIKQLGSMAKKSKQFQRGSGTANQSKQISKITLASSKSQETLPTFKIKQQNLQQIQLSAADQAKIQTKRKQFQKKANDLENKKQNLHQDVNNLNKDKRLKTKKNGQLKIKLKQLESELSSQEASLPLQKAKSKDSALTEEELTPILTRIYAYLFEDQNNEIVVERFLADNQHFFQLPTNPALLNEWKILMKNAELKKSIKRYEGEQPRQKKINEIVNQQNLLMSRLLRSFIRERYIWEWVNIIAHE